MDIQQVRRAIVSARERQGLNQQDLATRAGIRQGHLSNIENVDGLAMKDISARVVFQIIEQGLGLSVAEFFTALDSTEQKDTETTKTALTSRKQTTNNPPSLISVPALIGDLDDGAATAPLPDTARHADYITIGYALVKSGELLVSYARGASTESHRKTPPARDQESRRRRRGPGTK